MTQILQKRPAGIVLRAGSLAKQRIQQEGLSAHQVDMIPGAAGGPKQFSGIFSNGQNKDAF